MNAEIEAHAVDPTRIDQRVTFWDVPWALYESALASRGDRAVPRLTYNAGTLETMSPSAEHESIAMMIDRLLVVWADETDTELNAFGSWTVHRKSQKLGLEPDQSYVLGSRRPRVPDLAVEVVWTHGGIDKLEIYAALGVREVWFWRAGQIEVHVLGATGYRKHKRSNLLPSLDLALLARFLREPNQLHAIRAYREALRTMQRPS